MTTMTALKAKTHFGDVLDRVSRGEEIVITRHERPVARVIPEGRADLVEIRDAAKGLIALQGAIARRTRNKPPLTDAEVKSGREEGRR